MAEPRAPWRPLVGFDLPQPAQQPAAPQEVDRSWMPRPATSSGGIDWWKGEKWREQWEPSVKWAATHNPEFHTALQEAEARLASLERAHADTHRARYQVGRLYAQLEQLRNAWFKTQPFIRY